MSDEPKVHLTEEQWAYIKRHENERTREMNRHNAQIQLALAEALHLMAKSQSIEDKRDWFAGQALAGFTGNTAVFASNNQNGWDLVNASARDIADRSYWLAEAMMAARADSNKEKKK